MGKNIAKTVRTCRNITEKAYIILENTCFCVLVSIAAGCLVLSFVLVRWDHKRFLKNGNSQNYSAITTEGPKFTRLMSPEKYKNVIYSTMFYQMDDLLKPPTLKYNGKIKDQVGIEKLRKKRSKRLARNILNKNIDNQEIKSNVQYKYQSIVSSSTITTTEIKILRKKHQSSRLKNRTGIKNNTYNPNTKLIKSNDHKNILRRRNHLTSNSNYQATTEKNLGKLRKKSTLRHRNYHRANHSGKIKRDQVMPISESSTDHIQSFTSNLLPTGNKTTFTTYKTISTAFNLQTTKLREHTTKPYKTDLSTKADETDTASITTEPMNVIIFPNATNTSYPATTPLKPVTSSSSVKATISSSVTISISDLISATSIEPTTSFTTTEVNSYPTINTSFSNKPSTATTTLIIETTIFKIVSHITKATHATTTAYPTTTSISTFYTTKITTDSTITPGTTTRNSSNAKFSSLPFPITSPRVETSTTTSIPTTALNTPDIMSSTNLKNSPTKILSTTASITIVPSAATSLTIKTTTPDTTSSTRWLTSTSPPIPNATLTSISKLTKQSSPIIPTTADSTSKSTAIVLTTGLEPTMRPPPKFKRQHDPTEALMSKPYMRLVIPTLPTFIGLTMIGTGMLLCMRLNSLCCVPCIRVTDHL